MHAVAAVSVEVTGAGAVGGAVAGHDGDNGERVSTVGLQTPAVQRREGVVGVLAVRVVVRGISERTRSEQGANNEREKEEERGQRQVSIHADSQRRVEETEE